MLNHAPKVMIYRVGKYTPYKGRSQEIEILLKFINNEEQPVTMSFEDYYEHEHLDNDNPQDDNGQIVSVDKIETSKKTNCSIDLPKGDIKLELKNVIDKRATGTVIQEDVKEKRSKEELG
jgi:hypothetical protein